MAMIPHFRHGGANFCKELVHDPWCLMSHCFSSFCCLFGGTVLIGGNRTSGLSYLIVLLHFSRLSIPVASATGRSRQNDVSVNNIVYRQMVEMQEGIGQAMLTISRCNGKHQNEASGVTDRLLSSHEAGRDDACKADSISESFFPMSRIRHEALTFCRGGGLPSIKASPQCPV